MLEVRRLRKKKGWNQTELAFHADLAPSVISQIENGKRSPSARTLGKLAWALEVDVADLFPKGQAPLPLEEDRRQRGDPFLEAWTYYLLRFAQEWGDACPAEDVIRAKPQLAYEVLSKNELVQEECHELLLIVGKAINDSYTPPDMSPEVFARARKEGLSHYQLVVKMYEGRADIQKLVEATIQIDRLAGLWGASALHARNVIREVSELRLEPAREDERFEKAAETRKNTALLVRNLNSVA